MAATHTLALSQASYSLLDILDDEGSAVASARKSGTTEVLQAVERGGEIAGVSVSVNGGFGEGLSSFNVTDRTTGLQFTDSDTGPSPGDTSNAYLNLLGNADQAWIDVGNGDNRVNAARNFENSTFQSGDGSDTFRVGGSADNAEISLGEGNDQLTIGRSSSDLNADLGKGDDTALFLGTLTNSDSGLNAISMGAGNDRATFLGGIQGRDKSPYLISLGEGDDVATFGSRSTTSKTILGTGDGADTVILGRTTDQSLIDLGSDSQSGDEVILGVGATLESSYITSGNASDTLRLAGSVTNTNINLYGDGGQASVAVDGAVAMGDGNSASVWDLGSGDDTLIFSDLSTIDGDGYISLGAGSDELILNGSGFGGYGALEFDLGSDSDSDTIRFGDSESYAGITISNFGQSDILFIGLGSYGYGYSFINEFANAFDLDNFRNVGNVIWAQDFEADPSQQSIMTLDDTDFTLNDDGTSSVIAGDGTYLTEETTVISDLADEMTWFGAMDAEEPQSTNPPSASLGWIEP